MVEKNIYDRYSGEWVLLFNYEIIDHSANVEDILRIAEERYPDEEYPEDSIKITKVLQGNLHKILGEL